MSTDSEKRAAARKDGLSNHMAQIKLPGEPVYQLKLQDVSSHGAGLIVRPDSKFLAMIRIGQELEIFLLCPRDSQIQSGTFRARIEHISELDEGRFRGHRVVGLSLEAKGSGEKIPPVSSNRSR